MPQETCICASQWHQRNEDSRAVAQFVQLDGKCVLDPSSLITALMRLKCVFVHKKARRNWEETGVRLEKSC
jgi:hypothetical protein